VERQNWKSPTPRPLVLGGNMMDFRLRPNTLGNLWECHDDPANPSNWDPVWDPVSWILLVLWNSEFIFPELDGTFELGSRSRAITQWAMKDIKHPSTSSNIQRIIS
jgi:hypothetical protein